MLRLLRACILNNRMRGKPSYITNVMCDRSTAQPTLAFLPIKESCFSGKAYSESQFYYFRRAGYGIPTVPSSVAQHLNVLKQMPNMRGFC